MHVTNSVRFDWSRLCLKVPGNRNLQRIEQHSIRCKFLVGLQLGFLSACHRYITLCYTFSALTHPACKNLRVGLF